MKIGIIGAMEEEITLIVNKMSNVEKINIANLVFYSGVINNKNIVIVRSGIGKVNSSMACQILIDKFNISYVINTGVAGALVEELNIGDIVLSTTCIQHDVDVTMFGYKKGEIPRMESSVFKASEKLIEIAKKVNNNLNIFTGRVVSGDQFISSDEKVEQLIKDFNPMCVEMEGASIAQVATLNNIPFLVIRAISDNSKTNSHCDYQKFEKEAAVNSSNLTLDIINNLK